MWTQSKSRDIPGRKNSKFNDFTRSGGFKESTGRLIDKQGNNLILGFPFKDVMITYNLNTKHITSSEPGLPLARTRLVDDVITSELHLVPDNMMYPKISETIDKLRRLDINVDLSTSIGELYVIQQALDFDTSPVNGKITAAILANLGYDQYQYHTKFYSQQPKPTSQQPSIGSHAGIGISNDGNVLSHYNTNLRNVSYFELLTMAGIKPYPMFLINLYRTVESLLP